MIKTNMDDNIADREYIITELQKNYNNLVEINNQKINKKEIDMISNKLIERIENKVYK